MLVCLLVLTVTFFILTLYSIVQANMALFHIRATLFWSVKILDTSTAATLFVTVVGALLVRHQFALGVLPRIDYKSSIASKQNKNSTADSFETWRVDIVNTGLGSAVINHIEYFLEIATVNNTVHSQSFAGIKKELATIDLIHERDYWLENITKGFSLSPKDNCPVFEIRTEYIKAFKRLGMTLYFEGQLGDRYRSEISLIPHSS